MYYDLLYYKYNKLPCRFFCLVFTTMAIMRNNNTIVVKMINLKIQSKKSCTSNPFTTFSARSRTSKLSAILLTSNEKLISSLSDLVDTVIPCQPSGNTGESRLQ